MGQIIGSAAKPKRCNANQLSQVPTPAAGEHILVSSDNSMNAAGQGNFDCYIKGDGTTAASNLPLKPIDAYSFSAYYPFTIDLLEDTIYGSIQPSGVVGSAINNLTTDFIRCVGGSTITINVPTFTVNGTTYTITCRVVGMQDTSNTGSHMIVNGSAGTATGNPYTITMGADDNYFRISFYIKTKGTTTAYQQDVKQLIPQDTLVTLASTINIVTSVSIKEKVTELDGRVNEIQENVAEVSAKADENEADIAIINDSLAGNIYYPLSVDLIRDTIYGSIQGSGAIAAADNILTSAFLKCVGGAQLTITPPTFSVNNVEYSVVVRVVGMQDKANTGAHLIYNGVQYNATGTAVNVTLADTDKFFRVSFYTCQKNTRTQISGDAKAFIPTGTSVTIDSTKNIIDIPSADDVRELRSDVDGLIADVDELKGETTATDIVSLNKQASDIILPQFKKELRNLRGQVQSVQPLVLLHFSDLHAVSANLTRILAYKSHYTSYIDDAIHTGDSIPAYWTDTAFNYWHSVGADNILNVIGNHDTASYNNGWNWYEYINLPAYNRYIAPFVSGWGVTQPANASTDGKCYYYKDYAGKGIRLIVLDDMSAEQDTNNVQLTWFENVLADALTNNLNVIVAAHYPNRITAFATDCSFHCVGSESVGEYNSKRADFVSKVDTFISNGGTFVCWLTGHTHRDMFGLVQSTTNPQLSITISTAAYLNQPNFDWIDRKVNTKSMDLFNIVKFDTVNKWISLFRIGADYDSNGKHIKTMHYNFGTNQIMWDS